MNGVLLRAELDKATDALGNLSQYWLFLLNQNIEAVNFSHQWLLYVNTHTHTKNNHNKLK